MCHLCVCVCVCVCVYVYQGDDEHKAPCIDVKVLSSPVDDSDQAGTDRGHEEAEEEKHLQFILDEEPHCLGVRGWGGGGEGESMVTQTIRYTAVMGTCLLKPCFSSSTKVEYTLQGISTIVEYISTNSRKTTVWTT